MSSSGKTALLLGALALLPELAIADQAATPGIINQGHMAFKPPLGPMVLTRDVRRALADGKEITSRRRYSILVVAEGAGYRIDGHLLDVVIAAPPSLIALTDMERQRGDDGLFPIYLSHNGLIMGAPAPSGRSVQHQAAAQTLSAITASGLTPEEKQDSAAFIRSAGQLGTSAWPADLFHPSLTQHSQSRSVALPGGAQGDLTVATQTQAHDGLMQSYERVVTTRTGASERRNSEVWGLAVEQQAAR